MSGRIRCAIYTRKSSEEGLEQAFNSLGAQREACEAYIRSQAHEGWRCLPERFDDGGYSGGTLERPALQALMDAVRAGRVDVIVIYKIDRLTRSLTDFARLAELFEAHGVSFVSVTQQFNTTTSMGRLMLNVLLSFAQFEREVTGERIRDKIAASKKKGLWMGGFVPLGYEAKDRTLVINEEEAETVRTVFRLYLEHGNVRRVKEEADRLGLTTKRRPSEDGKMRGGRPLSRGHIYRLLSNPLYIGRIGHNGATYEGQHPPIIDQTTWDAVQAKVKDNTPGPRTRNQHAVTGSSLLAGLLFGENGARFTPCHATKKGRRYRYYVARPSGDHSDSPDRPLRLPAPDLERVVRDAITGLFANPAKLASGLGDKNASDTALILRSSARLKGDLERGFPTTWNEVVRPVIRQVVFRKDGLGIEFDKVQLRAQLGLPPRDKKTDDKDEIFHVDVPVHIRTRGAQLKFVLDNGSSKAEDRHHDPSLLRAIVRAHHWFEQLKTGEVDSIATIAKAEGLTGSYVTRVLKLAFLAPEITEQILDGNQPSELTADWLTLRMEIPFSWQEQRLNQIGTNP